ncbi:hypothetical protein [Limnoglobus roseus]|uniref:hypothetical protein n=1 Tax=Limnoglobus roseus TaxID=2598579 RepID=UPI0011EAEDEB|nr:hypothetical protein [Limnoglobus roseus]
MADLWQDDCGAVLSVEYVLVSGVLVTGIVPGLVAARNSINSAYANMGNSVTAAVPTPSYSGFSIGGANGNAIASVGGVSIPAQPQANYLQASQIAPIAVPAP